MHNAKRTERANALRDLEADLFQVFLRNSRETKIPSCASVADFNETRVALDTYRHLSFILIIGRIVEICGEIERTRRLTSCRRCTRMQE